MSGLCGPHGCAAMRSVASALGRRRSRLRGGGARRGRCRGRHSSWCVRPSCAERWPGPTHPHTQTHTTSPTESARPRFRMPGRCLIVAVAARSRAAAVLSDADATDGSRRKLWDNPGGPLPDVYVSETSLYLAEGEATQYTVSLTSAPGMREDTTVRDRARSLRCCYLRGWVGGLTGLCLGVCCWCRSTSTTTKSGYI